MKLVFANETSSNDIQDSDMHSDMQQQAQAMARQHKYYRSPQEESEANNRPCIRMGNPTTKYTSVAIQPKNRSTRSNASPQANLTSSGHFVARALNFK